MDTLDRIQQAFWTGGYYYSHHATIRTTERKISRSEIEEAILRGGIIEHYPDDKYGPSCLIYGKTKAGRPLHIQCSLPPTVKIITAYEPDRNKWYDSRIRRVK